MLIVNLFCTAGTDLASEPASLRWWMRTLLASSLKTMPASVDNRGPQRRSGQTVQHPEIVFGTEGMGGDHGASMVGSNIIIPGFTLLACRRWMRDWPTWQRLCAVLAYGLLDDNYQGPSWDQEKVTITMGQTEKALKRHA